MRQASVRNISVRVYGLSALTVTKMLVVDDISDKAILDVLFDIRINNPKLGLEQVHKSIKVRHPEWVLSIKVYNIGTKSYI